MELTSGPFLADQLVEQRTSHQAVESNVDVLGPEERAELQMCPSLPRISFYCGQQPHILHRPFDSGMQCGCSHHRLCIPQVSENPPGDATHGN